jgi:tRNA pseudouridine38-40 synthase
MNTQQYIFYVQYLGFRYHGFQRQTNAKTVQEMLEKTLKYVLKDLKFKIIPSSRTDAMVSANKLSLLLVTHGEINEDNVIDELNHHLPNDIKALELIKHSKKIDIIGDVTEKTYHYYFCHNQKMNPLAAPYFTNVFEKLDIELMQEGAKEFLGQKNYRNFCYQGGENKDYTRELSEVKLTKNKFITGNIFPEESYVFIVKGKGFMRHQIRLMMGSLFNLGLGKITLDDLRFSLEGKPETEKSNFVAPASGLILYDMNLSL